MPNPFRKPGKVVVGSAILAGTRKSAPLDIEFSDGIFTVPEWIINHLGGIEAAEQTAPSCKGITHEDFIRRFLREASERETLNRLQSQLFSFGRRR